MDPETQDTEQTPNSDGAQDAADLEAGFDDDSTALPPSDDDTPNGDGEQPASTEPEYVQLTRQEWEDMKARAARIDEIRATQDKSFGTMGGTIREIRQRIDAITNGKRVEIEQSAIDELRKDGFEAHAQALEKIRELQVVAGASADDIEKIVEERVNTGVSAYKQKLEARLLRKVHPDWETYQTAPEFEKWVAAQPAEYQQKLIAASNEWDSDVIAEAMTQAKAAAKAAASTSRQPQRRPDSRQAVLDQAIQPRGTGRATQSRLSAEEAMAAGFNED